MEVDPWIGELDILTDGLVIPPGGQDGIVPLVIWLFLLLLGVIGLLPRMRLGRLLGIIGLFPRVWLGRILLVVLGWLRRSLDGRKVIFPLSPGMGMEEREGHVSAPHAMEHAAEPLGILSLDWLKRISCLQRPKLPM